MTNEKKDQRKEEGRNKPPTIELSYDYDPVEGVEDGTFATTVQVKMSGRWYKGKPTFAMLRMDNEEEVRVEIRDGSGSFPFIGLKPKSYHVLTASARGYSAKILLTVPPLPKPKRPEEEALERERTELERARIAHELNTLTTKPTKVAKKLYVTFTGEDGQQRLVITVSDEAGNLIPNFRVVIIDGDTEKSRMTSAAGRLAYQTNFTERDRYVEVRAGNEHDLIWRASLNGPRQPGR